MQKICLLEKSFFQNQKLHKCYTFTKIFFPIFYNSSILLVQFRFLLSSFDLTSTILHYPPTLNQINSPHKNISNVITLHKLIVIPNDKLTSQLRSSQTDKTSKQKKEFEILLNAAISYQIARIRRIEESQDLIARVFYQLLPLCLSSQTIGGKPERQFELGLNYTSRKRALGPKTEFRKRKEARSIGQREREFGHETGRKEREREREYIQWREWKE